jgi:RNA polymerase sigma factor (sigma-70 family)
MQPLVSCHTAYFRARFYEVLGMLTEEQKALIVDNMLLVHYVINKQLSRVLAANHIDTEDAAQQALARLVKVIHLFDPLKAKYATWAVAVIRNAILMMCREGRRHCISQRGVGSLDEMLTRHDGKDAPFGSLGGMIGVEDAGLARVDNSDTIRELRDAINSAGLTNAERRAFEGLIRGEKQIETARALGMSQSYVSRMRFKARRKILKARDRNERSFYKCRK